MKKKRKREGKKHFNKKGHNMKMHIVIGLAVLAVLYYLNVTYKWMEIPGDTNTLLQLIIIGVIYSNMPDIDQPGSITNKWATVAIGALIVFSFMNEGYETYGIIGAIVLVLLRLIEHRTLIHSVLGAAIISAPLWYLSPIHALVGFIAFLSHIVADNDFSFGWEKDHRI